MNQLYIDKTTREVVSLPANVSYGRIQAAWEGSSRPTTRRDGRVDEGAGLENRYGAIHRGFESHSLRQINNLDKPRGGARVVDWGRLLSGCRVFSSTVGSNPTLPAMPS